MQEAKDLPDTDNFLFNIKHCIGHEKDVTDPYVAVLLDTTRIITTSVRYKDLIISALLAVMCAYTELRHLLPAWR